MDSLVTIFVTLEKMIYLKNYKYESCELSFIKQLIKLTALFGQL